MTEIRREKNRRKEGVRFGKEGRRERVIKRNKEPEKRGTGDERQSSRETERQ